MPSGTGEGDNLNRFCLRPSEGWEKVANGRMRALSAHDSISDDHALAENVIGFCKSPDEISNLQKFLGHQF